MRFRSSVHLSFVVGALSLAAPLAAQQAPSPDPRIGLKPGRWDAGEAAWNLRLLSATKPPDKFVEGINSDLAFLGKYAIQGNFNGYQVWDITDPSHPTIKTAYFCPASQSDVSVYKNILVVSSEATAGRLDCGAQGVRDSVSHDRIRGIRVFDISDITAPKYVTNVQTCRGSHTHSLLVDPKDKANVYVYISGSSFVRSPNELPGCITATPDKDPNSALMRIEIIKIPLAHPEKAAVVSTPRIFHDLKAPPTHGATPTDSAAQAQALATAKARGAFTVKIFDNEQVAPNQFVAAQLDSIVKARGGTGAPTGADSATLRSTIQGIIDKLVGGGGPQDRTTTSQCHDITLYPAMGLAGGACEGHGLLLDIKNPAQPIRLDAVDDKNFAYWHSATFNNDATKVLFSDEWGGGGAPKCRSTDPKEWGADALFTIDANKKMHFQSYYKLPVVQTAQENCVAHNGSLLPIPGRDIMAQAWYQGGISVFEWTDAAHPKEIAFFDRGPLDSTRMILGGPWSVYWYNGVIVSSEITRGLDILELVPSDFISQNEIDAAKSIHMDYLNVQDQQHLVWPASFSLARAYVDQLERSNGLTAARITATRDALTAAEKAKGTARKTALAKLATQLDKDAKGSSDAAKVKLAARAVRDLAK